MVQLCVTKASVSSSGFVPTEISNSFLHGELYTVTGRDLCYIGMLLVMVPGASPLSVTISSCLPWNGGFTTSLLDHIVRVVRWRHGYLYSPVLTSGVFLSNNTDSVLSVRPETSQGVISEAQPEVLTGSYLFTEKRSTSLPSVFVGAEIFHRKTHQLNCFDLRENDFFYCKEK